MLVLIIAKRSAQVQKGIFATKFISVKKNLPELTGSDIFEALKLQDEIQCKYTGGTVLHLFLGEKISDIGTVKKLIAIASAKNTDRHFAGCKAR